MKRILAILLVFLLALPAPLLGQTLDRLIARDEDSVDHDMIDLSWVVVGRAIQDLQITTLTDEEGVGILGSDAGGLSPALSFQDGTTVRSLLGIAFDAADLSATAADGDTVLRNASGNIIFAVDDISGTNSFRSGFMLENDGDIRIGSGEAGDEFITFQRSGAQAADITYIWPPDDGNANDTLVSNGTGTLTWVDVDTIITDIWVDEAGDTMTGGLFIDGGSDEIHLRVQAFASQTTNIFQIEESNGDLILHIDEDGEVEITHTADENEDHALRIIADAAGFGDVRGIDISYQTNAIVTGEDEEVILISIDESLATGGSVAGIEILATEGSATIYGLEAGAVVNPILQLSGTFVDMDSALSNAANVRADFISEVSNVEIFSLDDDTVTIGDGDQFEEIEFLLNTVSSKNIQPVFEFSTGIGTWTVFSPTDGTNGMTNTGGVVAWTLAEVSTWMTGLAGEFLIRITRTRNVIATPPIERLVQIAAVREYIWDANADLFINSVFLSGTASDGFETRLFNTNPTADRTATFPDASGEVSLLGQLIDLASEVEGVLPAAGVAEEWVDEAGDAMTGDLTIVSDNGALMVTGVGLVDGNNLISGNTGTVTGSLDAFRLEGSVSTRLNILVQNSGAGAARQVMRVLGAGDASVLYEINGGETWSVGLDNDDSDVFKISNGANLGTGDVLSISATTGDVAILNDLGIRDSTPSFPLDVAGGTLNTLANFTSTDAFSLNRFTDSVGSAEIGTTGDGFIINAPTGTRAVTIDSSQNMTLVGDLTIEGSTINGSVGSGLLNLISTAATDVGSLGSVTITIDADNNGAETLTFQTSTGVPAPFAIFTEAGNLDIDGNYQADGVLNIDGTADSYILGQLGIGITAPTRAVHAQDTAANSTVWMGTENDAELWIFGVRGDFSDSFNIRAQTTGTNALTITPSGDVGINDVTPDARLDVLDNVVSNYAAVFFNDGNATTRWGISVQGGEDTAVGSNILINFNDGNGTQVGTITWDGTNMLLNTISTREVKKNIRPTILEAIPVISGIKVRDFDPIDREATASAEFRGIGFIAEELEMVYPKAVTTTEDGTKMVGAGALIPVLVKGLQEALERIEELETAIGSLR